MILSKLTFILNTHKFRLFYKLFKLNITGFQSIYVDYKSMIKENLLGDDNKFVTVRTANILHILGYHHTNI